MKAKKIIKAVFSIVCIIVIIVSAMIISIVSSFNGKNPYAKILLSSNQKNALGSITRMYEDDDSLYYMQFVGSYDSLASKLLFKYTELPSGAGGAAFSCENLNGHKLVCRSYDLAHFDEDENETSLTMVIRTIPDDGYTSVAIADVCRLNTLPLIDYNSGDLDDGITNVSPLIMLPYLCHDGMNEKGLMLSVLSVGENESENQNAETASKPFRVLRDLLDNCADANEAIHLASEHDLTDSGYHLFVSDSSGISAILEWRSGDMVANYVDAAANFYMDSDDAGDYYIGEEIYESFSGAMDVRDEYHYGRGFGYNKFNNIISMLDERKGNIGQAAVSRVDLECMLSSLDTDYDGTVCSGTKYSVIFNTENLKAQIYTDMHPEGVYTPSAARPENPEEGKLITVTISPEPTATPRPTMIPRHTLKPTATGKTKATATPKTTGKPTATPKATKKPNKSNVGK